MPSGFAVEPAVLRKASTDLIDCIKPAQNMDVEGVSGSSEWYGHDGVYGALARFCPTWQIAIALLTQRSAQAGQALHGMAQNYAQADESGGQHMRHLESTIPPS